MNTAARHYENFPVASRLLPAHLRPHVAAVYAFARVADDIADEGHASFAQRLAALEFWEYCLHGATSAESAPATDSPVTLELRTHSEYVFPALHHTIAQYAIPLQLFRDLLNAFKQDCFVEEYESFADVLDYCRLSANPVGRIMLALFGVTSVEAATASDALCTALQLANFWQDVSVDAEKPRLYIPIEDLREFGVTTQEIMERCRTPQFEKLMRFELQRTRDLFDTSRILFRFLRGASAVEIRAVWLGGMRILDKIERDQYTVLAKRPSLSKGDYVSILLRAFLPLPRAR